MGKELNALLASMQLGEAQTYKNITVLPLSIPDDGGPAYLTLGEAIGAGLLVVTELSEAGSVPDLKVVNRADLPILLLDGEELIGAKQNRALNLKSHLLKRRMILERSRRVRMSCAASSSAKPTSRRALRAPRHAASSSNVSSSLRRR